MLVFQAQMYWLAVGTQHLNYLKWTLETDLKEKNNGTNRRNNPRQN